MTIDLLRKHGIVVGAGFQRGRDHKTTCPKCSAGRVKKTDRCLSIKFADGVLYANCWHCGWKIIDDGAEHGPDTTTRRSSGSARPRRGAAGTAWRDRLRASWS